MKKRILSICISFLLILVVASPAYAQTYSFSIDKETVDVYWESDGSLSLLYQFVFTNATFADPIDYVDIGIPTSSYNISNISAEVDDKPIYHIAYSSYVDGIELGLGGDAIQPGQTGTVNVYIGGISDVLYIDSSDPNYASAVFSPTWFDKQFVSGSTDLTVNYHLPPGVQSHEGRWHRAPSGFYEEPMTGFDENGRVVYSWNNPNANGYTQYLFGASFPSSYVPSNTIATPTFWQRLGIDPEVFLGFAVICTVAFFVVGIPILAVIGGRRRRMQYLPPTIAIAGHGIKRGLTAVEAGILLEQPMDKILTMILFSVIKKGAATVKSRDPLKIELSDPLPKGLRDYETTFLFAMKLDDKTKRSKQLQDAIVTLVKTVKNKMNGFSARETRNYYREITKKAWTQVQAADTPEVKSEKFEEVMEWTMLDKDYDDRTQDVFRDSPVFVPVWWPSYDPTYRSPSVPSVKKTSSPASRPTPGGSGLPRLPGSDFAASMVNGVQSFAAGAVGNLTNFTTGITNKTNPPPPPSTSGYSGGSSGGGGSSCACACACAGCACACAGGGR